MVFTYPPLCAIERICMHIQNPKHASHTIVWTQENTACTDTSDRNGWCCSCSHSALAYPGKATQISHKGLMKCSEKNPCGLGSLRIDCDLQTLDDVDLYIVVCGCVCFRTWRTWQELCSICTLQSVLWLCFRTWRTWQELCSSAPHLFLQWRGSFVFAQCTNATCWNTTMRRAWVSQRCVVCSFLLLMCYF